MLKLLTMAKEINSKTFSLVLSLIFVASSFFALQFGCDILEAGCTKSVLTEISKNYIYYSISLVLWYSLVTVVAPAILTTLLYCWVFFIIWSIKEKLTKSKKFCDNTNTLTRDTLYKEAIKESSTFKLNLVKDYDNKEKIIRNSTKQAFSVLSSIAVYYLNKIMFVRCLFDHKLAIVIIFAILIQILLIMQSYDNYANCGKII